MTFANFNGTWIIRMVGRTNPYLPCKYVQNTYISRTKDYLSTSFISISRILTFANTGTSRHRYRVRYLYGVVIINRRVYDAFINDATLQKYTYRHKGMDRKIERE